VVGRQPTESEAEAVAKRHLERINGVEIDTLEHVDHVEGHEHQLSFEVTFPQSSDVDAILQKAHAMGSPFDWVKASSGINEIEPAQAEGMIRCYYGE